MYDVFCWISLIKIYVRDRNWRWKLLTEYFKTRNETICKKTLIRQIKLGTDFGF